jgi:DNA-binding XRE family transcriptional regulator
MIKTENEYQECLKRLREDLKHIEIQRQALQDSGLKAEQIECAMQPALSFHEQLKEEVQWYERIKRREFGEIHDLTAIGPMLVALRIANGITQTELAKRLGVNESLVSRDERNEYHGITLERAQRILDALKEHVCTQIEDKPFRTEDELALA